MPIAAYTPDVAPRGRRVPERSIHHARVRALVRDAVRAASVREDQRIGIDLDDAMVRARDHVVLESSSRHDDASKRGVGEAGSLPPLAIVMLVVGTRGDVQPFIPIGRRLARDGHRVRLATHAVFRDLVESHGLEFYPLAGDPRQLIDYMVYVSHGYNTSQAFSQLISVTEGTLIVYASRVSTDQVAGFGSSMKKKIGRTVMAKQLTDVFERSRASFR